MLKEHYLYLRCQWVTEAESQLEVFIRHIEVCVHRQVAQSLQLIFLMITLQECTPLVMEILGRLCLCSGKPVTAVQSKL